MDHKTLSKVIKRRHPKYDEMLEHWQFLQLSYDGGREWFERNIFRYHKEGSGEYKNRKERAYRFNHTREVVDLVNKYLFRGEIIRKTDDAPDCLRDFWQNATLKGLNMDEFARIASTKSSIGGRPWVIVDNNFGELGVTSKKSAEESDARVYAYIVPPERVLDLSYDDSGQLNWIMIEEVVRDDADPFDSTGDERSRYRIWTRDSWHLIDEGEGGELKIDSKRHDLGEVPAVPVDNMFCDDPYVSPALIADIAYLDRAVANYLSNLDAIFQDQTFSQLAMPAQGVLPGDDAYNKLLEMGTKRVFLYDGEGGNVPTYLSPDPRQAQLIISAVQQIINEIYHSVGLAGERTKQDNSKGIDNSSGVAKAKDFERVVALLQSKAESLETFENHLARLVCNWHGVEPPEEDLVCYPSSFDVRGLSDELYIAAQLSILDLPPLAVQEQLKQLVEKLFPSMGEEMRNRLHKEIEEQPRSRQESVGAGIDLYEAKGRLLEEAKRNRDIAGARQSDTKSRETGSSNNAERQAIGEKQ